MKKVILFSLLIIVLSCHNSKAQTIGVQEIFKRNFEWSFISKGDNLPDFQIKKDSMDFFLIALHNEISLNEFQTKAGFTNEKTERIIALLETKKWLHKINDKYKPNVFIATQEDGKELYEYAKPISNQIAKSIENMLPSIKTKFIETDISKTQSFEEWSFFILSNVLLDNWQILNVENKFLGANSRPVRHGKYYYASIKESNKDKESFGIYGNQCWETKIYGNNRYNVRIPETQYYISPKDNKILTEIAEEYLPELVKVLQKNRKYCEKIYKKIEYSDEITFEEFFMWWYHFIYTQATDIMNTNKILTVPEGGNFFYKMDY